MVEVGDERPDLKKHGRGGGRRALRLEETRTGRMTSVGNIADAIASASLCRQCHSRDGHDSKRSGEGVIRQDLGACGRVSEVRT